MIDEETALMDAGDIAWKSYQIGLSDGWRDCLQCVKQIMKGNGMFTHKQLLKEIEKRIRWKTT